MTSDKKIEANRANAEKSTGPTTERGKSLSRFNSVKQFGIYAAKQILPGESPAAYSALMTKVFYNYEPEGPMETILCRQIVHCMWRLTRLQWAELAALKRSMVAVAVNTARYKDGRPAASEEDIDFSLISVLAPVTRPLETDASELELPKQTFKQNDLPEHAADVSPPGNSADAKNFLGDTSKTAMSESASGEEESKFFCLVCDPPPNGMTLLKSYADSETNKLCLEIDRQVRAVTKHMLRLQAALEAIQDRSRALDRRATSTN